MGGRGRRWRSAWRARAGCCCFRRRGRRAFLGPAWFLAIVAAAAAAHPGVPHRAVLDCADAPGQALAALRAGLRELVLDPGCPAFAAVAGAAAACGAAIWPARPATLDLGRLDLRKSGGAGQARGMAARAG